MTTIYLHGFLSSPNSNKGRLLKRSHESAGIQFIAPELYLQPNEVQSLLKKIVSEAEKPVNVIGSSLGGLYAAWAAENLNINRVVLLNPALGNWGPVDSEPGWYPIEGSEKKMYVGPSFLEKVIEMLPATLTCPERYLGVFGQKDETLDWKVGASKFNETNQIILAQADHRLSNFGPLVPIIMSFLANGF